MQFKLKNLLEFHFYRVSCGVVISPKQQYLLEFSLSTRLTTKVSLAYVCSVMWKYCALQQLLRIFQRKSLKNVTWLFVSIQIVSGSGYYGIECLYRIIHNLKTPPFLVAWILEVKTKRLTLQCSIRLARYLCSSTSLVTFSCYRTGRHKLGGERVNESYIIWKSQDHRNTWLQPLCNND